MKQVLRALLFLKIVFYLLIPSAQAQSSNNEKLLRIYEDNDYMNIRDKGTDKGYTAGTRFDVFYKPKRKPGFFFRFLSNKKDSIVYEGSWGIVQLLYTPNNISVAWFQPNDYFYSRTLFVNHSIYSFNPARHFSFQTDLLAGIRGPAAFGKQTQTFVHRTIGYTTPKGWDNQLQNSPLLNLNFSFEKQLFHLRKAIELIGGSKAAVGTLQNSLSMYGVIRAGVMNGYFNGYMSQYAASNHQPDKKKKKIQAYIFVKPQMQFIASDASIEGGAFAKHPSLKLDNDYARDSKTSTDCSVKSIRNLVYSVGYGAVFSIGTIAFSFIQNYSTESRRATYSHEVGNLSVFITL